MIKTLKYYYDYVLNFKLYSSERNRVKGTPLDRPLPRNIYGYVGTYSDYLWYHDMLHRIVKYLFLVPLIKFINFCFGRWLTKSVDLTPETSNLYFFNLSYEDALFDWCECFLLRDHWRVTGTRPDRDKVLHLYNTCLSVKILRTFKELVLTFSRNDSAYLSFLNFLVFRLTVTMNKNHSRTQFHLIYTSSSICNVKYFMLADQLHLHNIKNYGTEDSETKP